MTAAVELRTATAIDSWRIPGRGSMDDGLATAGVLWIRADGTWGAEVSMFTLGNQVDLLFESNQGGHFCGPAFVERSRVDSNVFAMRTVLTGVGPLLIVAPGRTGDLAELAAQEVIEAEEVE